MTVKTQFIFVHGWGTDSDFWDTLLAGISTVESTKIDFGFLGEKQVIPKRSAMPSVYVTHSLGTMWALKNRYADMKALIAINGFGCFKNFTDERVLRAMQARLVREPEAQMKDFWAMCGLPSNNDLNIERLQEGLGWLNSWDMSSELKALQCPVLSLTGGDDPILPMRQMKKEWAGFNMHVQENGGHALPLTDAQWCTEHIRAFLDGL